NASVSIAQDKAKTAALLRRSTKVFEDAVMGNPAAAPPAPPRNVLLNLFPGFTPIQGGLPLLSGDQIMGAIGCSGGTAPQAEQGGKLVLDTRGKWVPPCPTPPPARPSPEAPAGPHAPMASLSPTITANVRCATLPALAGRPDIPLREVRQCDRTR